MQLVSSDQLSMRKKWIKLVDSNSDLNFSHLSLSTSSANTHAVHTESSRVKRMRRMICMKTTRISLSDFLLLTTTFFVAVSKVVTPTTLNAISACGLMRMTTTTQSKTTTVNVNVAQGWLTVVDTFQPYFGIFGMLAISVECRRRAPINFKKALQNVDKYHPSIRYSLSSL